MPIMTDYDLDVLSATAAAATPGPWAVADEGYGERYVYDLPRGDMCWMPDNDDHWSPDDAAHIAACSPDRIMRLVDELRELRARVGAKDGDQQRRRRHDRRLDRMWQVVLLGVCAMTADRDDLAAILAKHDIAPVLQRAKDAEVEVENYRQHNLTAMHEYRVQVRRAERAEKSVREITAEVAALRERVAGVERLLRARENDVDRLIDERDAARAELAALREAVTAHTREAQGWMNRVKPGAVSASTERARYKAFVDELAALILSERPDGELRDHARAPWTPRQETTDDRCG